MRTLSQKIDGLVAEGRYDYVDLWLIICAANEASDADPKLSRMERTLALVGLLLDRGFQAVDLLPAGKCKPWPDQGRMHILRTIERDWRATNDEPWLGSKYWFNLPEARR